MKPRSDGLRVDFNLRILRSNPEGEPARVQCSVRIELFLHSLHDLGRRCVNAEDVDALLDRLRGIVQSSRNRLRRESFVWLPRRTSLLIDRRSPQR